MSSQLFSLKGKVVVITGATKGIGEGMATGLAEAGADIILVHRKSTDPSRVVEKYKSLGSKVFTISADMSSQEEVDQILPQALKLSPTGEVDVLINNAGIARANSAHQSTNQDWNDVIQVNLTTPYIISRDFGKHWIENGRKGKIINTGSLYSFIGGLNVISYTASKSAIAGLTRGLSNEWAGKGIQVNSIIPGYIVTDMTEGVMSDPIRSKELLSRIPAGRWGDINDFKGPTVFLASEASDYLTGGALYVDGGFLAY